MDDFIILIISMLNSQYYASSRQIDIQEDTKMREMGLRHPTGPLLSAPYLDMGSQTAGVGRLKETRDWSWTLLKKSRLEMEGGEDSERREKKLIK